MNLFSKPEPLTDAELDRLEDFLEGCKSGKAMNVEELDGFFAALIADLCPCGSGKKYKKCCGGTTVN
jgi:uncharacterized protein YecA (UPF0149 family)